jgi:hypothetical protein
MGRACRTNVIEEEHVYIFVGKTRKKETIRIITHRWVDDIKIDLVETGWGGMDWVGLIQDRHKWRALVKAVMIVRVRRILGIF